MQVVERIVQMYQPAIEQDRRREHYRDYFSHIFEANPWLNPGQARILVAEVNGNLVGVRPCMPCQLMVHGTPHRFDWGVSFSVAPEMRGAGIGTALARAWAEQCPTIGALASGAAAQHIYRKLGFSIIAGVKIAVRILRPLRAFRDAQDLATRAGALGGALVGGRSLLSRSPDAALSVEPAPDLATEVGPDLPRLCAGYEWIATRTPEVLTWRFGHAAPHHYDAYVAREAGAVTGYVVVRAGYRRQGIRAGVIADVLAAADDPATYRALTQCAVKHFADREEVAVVVCRASHPALLRALRSEGFFITPREHSLMFHTTRPDLCSVPVSPAGRWHLTFGDSDGEFAPPDQ